MWSVWTTTVSKRATLNAWQWLWVVFTCVWVVFWVVLGIATGRLEPFKAALAMAVVPPVLLYAAGLGVAWIRRGFRG